MQWREQPVLECADDPSDTCETVMVMFTLIVSYDNDIVIVIKLASHIRRAFVVLLSCGHRVHRWYSTNET